MSEQILSQEEIDALLESMDKGDIKLDNVEKGGNEVKAYDLSSQGIMLRDQFYALEEVWDKFSTLLKKQLSSSLQARFNIEFVSTEMEKFGDFLNNFSNPTSFNVFTMEPLVGSAIFAIEPDLVFSLIDCMFGGNGKPIKNIREFTQVERGMITKFVSEALKCFEKAWKKIYPVKVILKDNSETKAKFVHVIAPNDLVVVVVFSISGDAFSGNIYVCISYLMLEPIKDNLSTEFLRDSESQKTWKLQLQHLLRKTIVEFNAILGKNNKKTVGDLMQFNEGDTIKLDKGPHDTVTIMVEGIPKFEGIPGIITGSRAVQISKVLLQDGGKTNNDNNGRTQRNG